MSGKKVTDGFGRSSRFSTYDVQEALEKEGDYRLASKIRRGECLDEREIRKVKHELSNQNLEEKFDYRFSACDCPREEDDHEN